MQEIFVLFGMALTAAFAALFLKDSRMPAAAALVALAAGALILLRVLPQIGALLSAFAGWGEEAGVNSVYLGTVLKVIAISYVAELGAQVCRDCGQGALAAKVELAAKIVVAMMAMPILASLLELVVRLF